MGPVEPHRVRDTAPSRIWGAYQHVRGYEPVLRWADVETLHELRIAGKWLRYTLEFVREPLGPDATPLITRVVALQDHLGRHADQLADAAQGVEERHPVGDELERVAVPRAHHHVEVLRDRSPCEGRDDVVGLVALLLDDGDPQGGQHLLDERDLTRELLRGGGTVGLVLRVLLGAKRPAGHVKRHDDVGRPLVAQHVDEHRGEPVDRIGRLTG